jgi:hypothetical protein
MSPRLRSLIVLLVGGAAVAVSADAIAARNLLTPRDFLEYWAAGRVNLRGGNPYHPDELLAEQKVADPARDHAVMMWNPPPALAVYMPLGAVGPRWATLLWIGGQLAAVLVACDWLWRVYGGPAHRWVGAAVAVLFVGTWWLVAYGQNTGLILLGLAGFLHFRRADRPLTAGACAALTALKPHLLACFGVLLIADALTAGGRKALAAGVGMIALALAATVATNPAVIGQFVEAVRHPAEGATPLSEWTLPVPAYWLRMALAPEHFGVQFVPCAVAGIAAFAYRLAAGARFDWSRALPVAVAVSVVVTPYGGWLFDLPVLLVPVIAAVAALVRTRQFALAAALVAGQAIVTAATFAWPGGLHAYWWVAPGVLALCLPAVFAFRANS